MTEEGKKSSQEEDRDINDDMENWKLTSRLDRIRNAQKEVEDRYKKQIEERNKTLHENWKERTSQHKQQNDDEEDSNDENDVSIDNDDDEENIKENEHSWKTENDFARVKFILPDGRTVTKYFHPGSTLEQLYEAAQTLLPSTWQSKSLSLSAKAPRRTLDDIDKNETLQGQGFVLLDDIDKNESLQGQGFVPLDDIYRNETLQVQGFVPLDDIDKNETLQGQGFVPLDDIDKNESLQGQGFVPLDDIDKNETLQGQGFVPLDDIDKNESLQGQGFVTLDDIDKNESLQGQGFVPSGTVMVQPIKMKKSYSWKVIAALICCLAVLGAVLYLYAPSLMRNDAVPEDGSMENGLVPTTEVSVPEYIDRNRRRKDNLLMDVYMFYTNYCPIRDYWHPRYTIADWLWLSFLPWLFTVTCLYCVFHVLWYN